MLYAGCGAADVELETWTDTRIAECVYDHATSVALGRVLLCDVV